MKKHKVPFNPSQNFDNSEPKLKKKLKILALYILIRYLYIYYLTFGLVEAHLDCFVHNMGLYNVRACGNLLCAKYNNVHIKA